MRRYRAAFGQVGAKHASYVYEPVGAAFYYARELERDAIVLVADFGGGTSDFSILRFSRVAGQLNAEPLSYTGIGIAGDAFDYRIVEKVVSPRLGKGGLYRSMGKVLALPERYFANLARWHQLAMMKSSGELKELKDLARSALDPEPLHQFIDIIELDLGFDLYRAVSKAKIALSTDASTEFAFTNQGIEIRADVTRSAFEGWISEDVSRIERTLDDALHQAGLPAAAVDRVFLTGGTSFVPAIRRLFEDRFGSERLTSSHQFASIAYGLALVGQSADPGSWTANTGNYVEEVGP